MTPAGEGQNEFYFMFIEAQITIRNSFLVCKQGKLRPFGPRRSPWAQAPGFQQTPLTRGLIRAAGCPWKCVCIWGEVSGCWGAPSGRHGAEMAAAGGSELPVPWLGQGPGGQGAVWALGGWERSRGEIMVGSFLPPLLCFAAKTNTSNPLQVLCRTYGERADCRASTSGMNFHPQPKGSTPGSFPPRAQMRSRSSCRGVAGLAGAAGGEDLRAAILLTGGWNCIH